MKNTKLYSSKSMRVLVSIILLFSFTQMGCNKFIDVIPDNIPTLENAFTLRSEAKRYLATCYSYMPKTGELPYSVLLAADEIWLPADPYPDYEVAFVDQSWGIAMGRQNTNAPLMNYWNGFLNLPGGLWRGIRTCNIFLENIDNVPELSNVERAWWTAEAKFLKAYYHFYLLRMYGPIPIVRENIPVSGSVHEVRVPRDPVDEVFDYIIQLLEEAEDDLPLMIRDEMLDLGRITRPIALAFKAKVLTYAASPLFNGNTDYADFKNNDGTVLFNPEYNEEKWQKAAEACREAIEVCEEAGMDLNQHEPTSKTRFASDEIVTQLSLRERLMKRWNDEVIWANTNTNTTVLQTQAVPFALDPSSMTNAIPRGNLGPTLNVIKLYYSENGVPIEEDRFYDYTNRFNLREGTLDEKLEIKVGYETAGMNFNREPRYYADLGFDGGMWYGQDKFDEDDMWVVMAKVGQPQGRRSRTIFSLTGYYVKKYVDYESVIGNVAQTYSMFDNPWVEIRLADLYLLYAEALNEAEGPVLEAKKYVNLVRERGGLKGVDESWQSYSTNPSKPNSKDGLREIIHRERAIELMFEGERFWDERRWKTAIETFNHPIEGWDASQELAKNYYRVKVLFDQTFTFKDYFWPLMEHNLITNELLVQNPGW